MNLSQDEINALMTDGDEGDNAASDAGEDASVDIMSPEAIAAMLDEAAGGVDPVEAGDADVVYDADTGDDVMTPEAIAAMLDAADASDAGDSAGDIEVDAVADVADGDDSGEIMSPEAIAALLDNTEDDFSEETQDAMSGVREDVRSGAPALEGMLTDEEVDILGEIGNISMGAVATTMYTLLDRRVSITTPRVYVYDAKDVLSLYKIPFVVATIKYTKGISGTNLLVLRVEDAALITDLLMGGDGTLEEPIELNEMHLSAMSEIMNQMMGASSTSLSKLLGKPIDIAPPNSSQVDVGFDVSALLGEMDKVTKIAFDMEIDGLLKSELIQLAPYEESRKFAKQFMDAGVGADAGGSSADSQAPASAAPAQAAPMQTPEAATSSPPAAAPTPPPPPMQAAPPQAAAPMAAPPPMAASYAQPPYQQPQYQPPPMADPYAAQYPYQQMPYGQPPPVAGQGRVVDVHPMSFQSFDAQGPQGEPKSIDLVYNIPLQVSVELGRAKKEISEILEFNLGTIIVLDKVAGDPVEIVVNGKLIARGEVVVIDDNYGVRITDIVNS